MRTYKIIATAILGAMATCHGSSALADAPTCHTHSSGPYCSYHGIVHKAYVNENNWILLYFDTALNPSAVAAVRLTNVTNYNACIYKLTDNADFAKAFYASILAAQARDARITVHMREGSSGYLQCDRIWVDS